MSDKIGSKSIREICMTPDMLGALFQPDQYSSLLLWAVPIFYSKVFDLLLSRFQMLM